MNCVIFETELGFIHIYAESIIQAWQDFRHIYPDIGAEVVGFIPADLLMEC